MENSVKRYSSGRGWRVATPTFPDCAAMDSFYEEAHRLLEEHFSALREGGERSVFVADYFIAERGDICEITLRLRRRIDGRYVDERVFLHRWCDGVIAPKRSHSPLRSLICSIIAKNPPRHKGKSKTDEKVSKKTSADSR